MFQAIKKQVQEQFAFMIKDQTVIFITDLDKDVLWNTYLDSFTDTKQEHNCSACRGFIKNYGNIVAIKDNKIVTLWDFEVNNDEFKPVIENLHKLVSKSTIRDMFISDLKKIGVDQNIQRIEGSAPLVWNHFSLELPNTFVNKSTSSREALMGGVRDAKNVFKRSLDELTQDSIETVLELIAQNSLYKGDEFKGVIQEFLKHKIAYSKLKNNVDKDNYTWIHSFKGGAVSKIRNTSIGTLLIYLSEGKELDKSVAAFERVVAPTNYKRPTALVTKRMIEEAEKTIKTLGYTESLGRRYATVEDISVNNLLFIDRNAKKASGVFAEMKESVGINPKTLKKVEEITIGDFIENVLPGIKNIEVLFENSHLSNLVSLITSQDKEAPTLFKWNNPFSWSYTNAVTDSIKEQVKAAGGKVEGELRISLSWFNYDDLDLHVVEPGGNTIYFRNKLSALTGGNLDVDMNAGSGSTRKAVENVIFPNKNRILEGTYKIRVNNYAKREFIDAGFEVEVECQGQIFNFSHTSSPASSATIDVVSLNYTKKDGVTFSKETSSKVNSKDKWGISTNKFHKVSMIMNSPNYWDSSIGNAHTFFILEGAKNDENARGFFNEFLKDELSKDRKVFEVLASKLRVEAADKQVSGLGFSSTQRNSVICKVEGKFERLLKINF